MLDKNLIPVHLIVTPCKKRCALKNVIKWVFSTIKAFFKSPKTNSNEIYIRHWTKKPKNNCSVLCKSLKLFVYLFIVSFMTCNNESVQKHFPRYYISNVKWYVANSLRCWIKCTSSFLYKIIWQVCLHKSLWCKSRN